MLIRATVWSDEVLFNDQDYAESDAPVRRGEVSDAAWEYLDPVTEAATVRSRRRAWLA
jgi:hypothetical protein